VHGAGGAGGADPAHVDDYYGYHTTDDYFGDVNIPAFQPSHMLTFEVRWGGVCVCAWARMWLPGVCL
jgi:hypothetical protein